MSNYKYPKELEIAAGALPIRLSNDIVFHMVVSKSNRVLKSLLCSLLDLKPSEVRSATLLNTIKYAEHVNDKYIILDALTELNNSKSINVEVQFYNDPFWSNRSMYYLCKSYCNLDSSEGFEKIKPTNYMMMNVVNHNIYTSNFRLNVLNCNHIDLATKEDKCCNRDRWAKLFMASTWEELKLIAADDDVFMEVCKIMYDVSSDRSERTLAEARDKYRRVTIGFYDKGVIDGKAIYEAELAEMNEALAIKDARIAELESLLKNK